jgi:hypothetical protein
MACFALYRWRRQAVLLVAGVIGVAIVAPEAVWEGPTAPPAAL